MDIFGTKERHRAAKAVMTACVAAGLLQPMAKGAAAGEQKWPAQVTSVYKLSFNGFEVGTFAFDSRTTGESYKATSSTDISALFGAFKWKGTTVASGNVSDKGPQPSSYQLSFRTKSKAGVVRLGFDQGAVKSYSVEPKKPPSPEAVPVRTDHLKSVFDPMSAVIALTQAKSGVDPCARRLAIFDGKVRFNLTFTMKGREKIADKKPSGQPGELYVCKVKYEPVAGHKPKDFVDPWINYSGIEIKLRPVPSANVFVPYTITVPTSIGSAVMSAEKIDITMSGQSVIALRR